MLNQSQLQSPKSYNHETYIATSPTAQSLFKKRPFMRKPGPQGPLFNLEQRNKHTEDIPISHDSVLNVSSPLSKQDWRQGRGKKSFIVETSNRERIVSTRNPAKDSIFYSPKAQNTNFWKDLSYISQNSVKKQDNKNHQLKRKNTNTQILNLNQKFIQVENKKDAGSQRNFKPGHVKNRTSSTNFLLEKDAVDEVRNKENQRQVSFVNSCGSKSSKTLTVECLYCKNNKKMAEIVNEKYHKLQKQFTSKLKQNLELEVLCNNLKIQNVQLKKEKDRILKQFQSTKSMFEALREDFLSKIEIQRQEIMKLKDRTKYHQIQKSILLRVKEDHHALTKTNLQLKNQHQIMKKTIIANNQAKLMKANFQKNKKIGTPEHSKSSRHLQKSFAFNSPQYEIGSDNQDDNVSLNFSEISVDNYLD